MELLLAVFLLSILLGALVFSFSRLDPNASLNEGCNQFKSLVRMAKAHAAYQGRKVRIEFTPDTSDPLQASLSKISLTWEPDPFERPGFFQTLRLPGWDLDQLNELVAVETVLLTGSDQPAPLDPANLPPASHPFAEPQDPMSGEDLAQLPNLVFYPDGSTESADILLVSRDPNDLSKMWVYLGGLTGALSQERLDPGSGLDGLPEEPDLQLPDPEADFPTLPTADPLP